MRGLEHSIRGSIGLCLPLEKVPRSRGLIDRGFTGGGGAAVTLWSRCQLNETQRRLDHRKNEQKSRGGKPWSCAAHNDGGRVLFSGRSSFGNLHTVQRLWKLSRLITPLTQPTERALCYSGDVGMCWRQRRLERTWMSADLRFFPRALRRASSGP